MQRKHISRIFSPDKDVWLERALAEREGI